MLTPEKLYVANASAPAKVAPHMKVSTTAPKISQTLNQNWNLCIGNANLQADPTSLEIFDSHVHVEMV